MVMTGGDVVWSNGAIRKPRRKDKARTLFLVTNEG